MRAGSDLRESSLPRYRQWVYSSVSSASLQKTGVFLDLVGEREHQSLETLADEKSPHLAGVSHQEKKILRHRTAWLATQC